MIKLISIFLLLVLTNSFVCEAQSFTIEIDVEPRVETSVRQSLDFGQIVTGSGIQQIPLGSSSMGIFQIRTLNAKSLIISLDPAAELVHEELGEMATIPLNLQANYTANNENDYRQSVPLTDLEEYITLSAPSNNPQSAWTSIYLYVFGNIDLGIVPTGVYSGKVVLNVVYE